MRKATALSTIRWMRMVAVKDCKTGECKCADKLRRSLLRIPNSEYEDKLFEMDILKYQIAYNECENKES